MNCQHVSTARLTPPRANQAVHREDCTQCFDGIDDPEGLNVCLSCFNGGCAGERNHALLHHKLSQHPLTLNIRRAKKPRVERAEPPKKISKLAIEAESENDKYDTYTAIICYMCGGKEVERTVGNLPEVVDGVMNAMTFSRQTEVQAWEQEMTPCEHTLCLQQEAPRKLESQNLATCSACDLQENLWLCLQCGNLGCGRAQFGGVGGSSHGLAHFDATHHPVSVKLGSITPEGTADVYCYVCNDEKTDTELAAHLAHWGINIAEREKTEKSLTEMQIEHNMKWEFSMTGEDGKELKPLVGKGLTGLKNLGNSCYLASILQCLFALPSFQKRYNLPDLPESLVPADDLETQLRKLADGLLSGRYARPDTDVAVNEYSPETPYQRGLAPAMFKALIGKGHEEFSTMRQQDAFELLLHLFKLISRSPHPGDLEDPVSDFRFALEQRLQCMGCSKVRYRTDIQDNISVPVPVRRIPTESSDVEMKEGDKEKDKNKDFFEPVTIKECLDIFTADEIVGFNCPSCGKDAKATKRHAFKTLPEVLAVNARRFEYINWVPTKIDVPVVVGDEPFLLDDYLAKPRPAHEELLPEDEDPRFQADEGIVSQLEAMGFPRMRAEKALYHTGNKDPEAAMNWLFAHMDDPDIDAPISFASKESAGAEPDEEKVSMLGAMGFTAGQAKKALKETGGDVERAVEWLFSHPDDMGDDEVMGESVNTDTPTKEPGRDERPAQYELHSIVCHKGGSIHAGHYVAFIRKEVEGEGKVWVLFNDEKVVKASDVGEMKKFA
ncbi:hypothetical protein B9Z19DRAFT_279086 [Tuber borchii]|uniref:Ubiquitin carboxyl-terminal hydrolase n=1 Tax=Tuber borchii TaxID=42251 RepID=A0A2T7A983_TUBBO|nr:hypothetical protein B9Z19DRAFT_279086 [Tuber borchii]